MSDEKLVAKTIDKAVALKVKSIRGIKGFSQNDVAEALGITFQQFQKYEKATNRISAGKLLMIARFLQTPVAQFFENFVQSESEEENPSLFDREAIKLLSEFKQIKSPLVRKKIIEICKSLKDD